MTMSKVSANWALRTLIICWRICDLISILVSNICILLLFIRDTPVRLIFIFRFFIVQHHKHIRSDRQNGDNETKNKKENIIHLVLLPASIKAPKDKIEGTQRPTYRPASLSPLNHKNTETKNDSPDAIKIPILLIFMFLNIFPPFDVSIDYILVINLTIKTWYIVFLYNLCIYF